MRKLLALLLFFVSSVIFANGAIDCPILIYHTVRPYKATDTRFIKEYVCTPENFEIELSYLRSKGFNPITFADLESYFSKNTTLPSNPLIISFDDGWQSQYQYALPILEKYSMRATFFVYTNVIGTKYYMTWEEIAALRDAGMEIGSHSLSHPVLTHINNPEKEIFGSKKVLEDHLKIAITTFAYPFGQYNAKIVRLVKAAGYLSARGTFLGTVHTRGELFTLTGIIRTNSVRIYEQELLQH